MTYPFKYTVEFHHLVHSIRHVSSSMPIGELDEVQEKRFDMTIYDPSQRYSHPRCRANGGPDVGSYMNCPCLKLPKIIG